jgi:catechol 2,3-dioxygenase-like lactoylglutathione lyase family enzyme
LLGLFGFNEILMPTKLDHCVIRITNWDVSNSFYERVVGAELVQRGAGWAYRFGDVQLNVHGPGIVAEPLARIPVAPGNSDLCFEWPGSVEEARTHLESKGVDIEMGPVPRNGVRGSGTSLYFRDPDGSLLEFICYEH